MQRRSCLSRGPVNPPAFPETSCDLRQLTTSGNGRSMITPQRKQLVFRLRTHSGNRHWHVRALATWVALISLLAVANRSIADDCCDKECDCQQPEKVCRMVCEPQKVKEHYWKCACEDFCIPPPSHCCGEQCECDCHSRFGQWCYKLWHPAGCPEVRTRRKLVKVEVEKKKPGYKWVAENACAPCGEGAP